MFKHGAKGSFVNFLQERIMQTTWPNDNYYRNWFGSNLTAEELAAKYKNYLKVSMTSEPDHYVI